MQPPAEYETIYYNQTRRAEAAESQQKTAPAKPGTIQNYF